MELEERIKQFVNGTIRARARVDGGDLMFEGFENHTVIIGAYGECATCICCEHRLETWLKTEINKKLGVDVKIRFVKHIPYFKKI